MFRYKCTVAYDGANYMGFQIQNDEKTIELELMKAIKKSWGVEAKIYASGRTDRYVHALGQVFHFDMDFDLPERGVLMGINAFLPDDIRIKRVEKVDDNFHARFSAISKEYRYKINIKEYDPLTIRYAPYYSNLDIPKMIEASKLLIGEHNFKGFASATIDPRKNTVKTIYSIDVIEENGILEFRFIGSSFLRYQIRRMMGLLIDIGLNRQNKELILEILDKCDPGISHSVAPGCGLYLYNVNYEV